LPLSRCPAVANADEATKMISCLPIARPNAATTDIDPSELLTDVNDIVEGDAEIETP